MSGSTPRSAASVRHRPYRVSGVSCSLGLRVAWTAHLTSRGVRSRPSAASRSTSRSIWSVRLENPRTSSSGHALAAHGCRGRPPPSTPPRASGQARAGRWPGRWRPRPADADTGRGRPTPSSVRPGPGRGWPPPDGCATAGHPPWTSGGRTRPPAAPVRTRAGHRHGRGGPPGARPGRRPPRPDTSVMGGQHRPAGRRVAQAIEDRHALGRAQHHVERGHRVAAVGAAQQLAGVGMAALEHPPGTRAGDASPCSPELVAPAPYHRPGDSPWPDRYCFVVGGQLAGVVLLPPHRELGDVGHHPAAPSSPSLAPATHPWCIALLGKDCGLE